MAPPPQFMAFKNGLMALRLVAFATLVGAMALLITNSANFEVNNYNEFEIHFKDVYSYRYMLVTIAIGIVYSFVQLVFNLYTMCTGNPITREDRCFKFDFYGDKFVSLLLATGAGAGFGATKDMTAIFGAVGGAKKFFIKGYASTGLLLIALVCIGKLSVYSSFALPKKA